MELGHLMNKWIHAGCYSDYCHWGRKRSEKYKLLQSNYGPLRLLEAPISDIIKDMEAVPWEDVGRTYHSHTGAGGIRGFHHEPPTSFAGELEALKNKVAICIDCVRSGNATTSCRFQHERNNNV